MFAALNWIEIGFEAIKHGDPLLASEQGSAQGGSTLILLLLFALVAIAYKILSVEKSKLRHLRALRRSLRRLAIEDAGSIPIRRVEQTVSHGASAPQRRNEGIEQVHVIRIVPTVVADGTNA
jgi:hypothetical protein